MQRQRPHADKFLLEVRHEVRSVHVAKDNNIRTCHKKQIISASLKMTSFIISLLVHSGICQGLARVEGKTRSNGMTPFFVADIFSYCKTGVGIPWFHLFSPDRMVMESFTKTSEEASIQRRFEEKALVRIS